MIYDLGVIVYWFRFGLWMVDSRGNWLMMKRPLHQRPNKLPNPGMNMPRCQLTNRPLYHRINIGLHANELIGYAPHKFISDIYAESGHYARAEGLCGNTLFYCLTKISIWGKHSISHVFFFLFFIPSPFFYTACAKAVLTVSYGFCHCFLELKKILKI